MNPLQKITFPTPSPTILEEEENEEAIRTSSPLDFDAAAAGDNDVDVSRTLHQRRKRVLSAIYEESPVAVAPAAASELPAPDADNRLAV